MCGFTGGGLVKYSRHNYCAEFSLTAHSGGRVVKVGYNTGNKYIFSPTINVRNSALCNLLCVYFSIGNPQVGKKNKQNNNLLIIKNFSKSQTHHKQQLQKHWTLLRLLKMFILRRFVFKSIWAENYKNHRKKNTDRMEYILSFSCLSFCS